LPVFFFVVSFVFPIFFLKGLVCLGGGGEVIDPDVYVLIFYTIFLNISHSKDNSARRCKCTHVFM